MEHTGIEEVNQTHQQHEPISFGIDQILNGSDQPSSCMLPSRNGDPDYALAPNVYSNGYNSMYNPACSMAAGLAGSYNVNMNMNVSMNMNVNVNSGNAGGVIRVPAHRPMPPAPHPPTSVHPPGMAGGIPSMPTVHSMGSPASFSFPWMESSRRFAKDRLTGKTWKYLQHCLSVISLAYFRKKYILKTNINKNGWFICFWLLRSMLSANNEEIALLALNVFVRSLKI